MNLEQNLEQLGAVAAILTCIGGAIALAAKFIMARYRRVLVERHLRGLNPPFTRDPHGLARQKVGQIAVALGMTSVQVYDAARNNKKLESGRDGAADETVWFAFKRHHTNSN